MAEKWHRKPVSTGVVYFVQAVPDGLIKIGHTVKNPNGRLTDLQAASPVRLQPLGIILGRRDEEIAHHRLFAHLREWAEWFRPAADLCDYIRGNTLPWPGEGEELPALPPDLYELRGEHKTLDEWADCFGIPRRLLKKNAVRYPNFEVAILMSRPYVGS